MKIKESEINRIQSIALGTLLFIIIAAAHFWWYSLYKIDIYASQELSHIVQVMQRNFMFICAFRANLLYFINKLKKHLRQNNLIEYKAEGEEE